MDILARLPHEVCEEILQHLSGIELAKCCLVSRKWREIANSNKLWKRLCKKDDFDNEDLVPMANVEAPPGLIEECEYKRFYNRGSSSLCNWACNRYKKFTLYNVKHYAYLGNDALLVVLTDQETIQLYDLNSSSFDPVQTIHLPNIDSKIHKLYSSPIFLIIMYVKDCYACYRLDECKLHFSQIVIPSLGTDEKLTFISVSTTHYFPNYHGTAQCVLTGIVRDTLILSRVVIYPKCTFHFFSLSDRLETRKVEVERKVYDWSVYKNHFVIVLESKIVSYDNEGNEEFHIDTELTLKGVYVDCTLHMNDEVILLQFWIYDKPWLKCWDWGLNLIRGEFKVLNGFILLHPKYAAVLHEGPSEFFLTRLRDDVLVWKQPKPDQMFIDFFKGSRLIIKAHFLVRKTSTRFVVHDLVDGRMLYALPMFSDYQNINDKVMQLIYDWHTIFLIYC